MNGSRLGRSYDNLTYDENESFATKAIHVGQDPSQWSSMAVIPPISLSTVYKQTGPEDDGPYMYSRFSNPTRNCLEQSIAALEGGKYGLVYSSGIAAITAATFLLKAGDHIVCSDDLYGGTTTFLKTCASRMGIETTFVDMTRIEKIKAALKVNTRMVYIESPTNPMMKITDIEAAANLARSHCGILTVIDNTFMSPYFQKPLRMGIDVVIHSVTKYINGHSDVMMGAIVVNNKILYEQLRYLQKSLGGIPSPFDCFLVNRGLKTLAVRMEKHMENGMAVAKYLEGHPMVKRTIHPGLRSHPQYELAYRQCSGYSGMVSFVIKYGCGAAKAFVSHLKLFTLTVSLGGVESLVEIPITMSHAGLSNNGMDDHTESGLERGLIRLSVGLESAEDLISDLEQAFLVVQRMFS